MVTRFGDIIASHEFGLCSLSLHLCLLLVELIDLILLKHLKLILAISIQTSIQFVPKVNAVFLMLSFLLHVGLLFSLDLQSASVRLLSNQTPFLLPVSRKVTISS